MKRNIQLLEIETNANSKKYQLYLNKMPYHIDKLAPELERLYKKPGFIKYIVYKNDKIYHRGIVLLTDRLNIKTLIFKLMKKDFSYLYKAQKNKAI